MQQQQSEILDETDIAIFAKNHTEQNEVVALLDAARTRGIPTIVDTCDDYFAADNPLAPYYRALIERANTVTTSSIQLAQYIEEATGTRAHVVRDPYEGPQGIPRWSPKSATVNALWFGTPWNLEALLQEVLRLAPALDRFKLEIVTLTGECPGLEEAFRRLNAQNIGRLTLRFKEWSLEKNWSELRECDLVVIPVDQQKRFFLAKGPNRLIEALWAGRFAVVNPLPAYQEFKAFAWIGESISDGIAWAVRHPEDVRKKIAEAQQYIATQYSPAKIAAEWEAAFQHASLA